MVYLSCTKNFWSYREKTLFYSFLSSKIGRVDVVSVIIYGDVKISVESVCVNGNRGYCFSSLNPGHQESTLMSIMITQLKLFF